MNFLYEVVDTFSYDLSRSISYNMNPFSNLNKNHVSSEIKFPLSLKNPFFINFFYMYNSSSFLFNLVDFFNRRKVNMFFTLISFFRKGKRLKMIKRFFKRFNYKFFYFINSFFFLRRFGFYSKYCINTHDNKNTSFYFSCIKQISFLLSRFFNYGSFSFLNTKLNLIQNYYFLNLIFISSNKISSLLFKKMLLKKLFFKFSSFIFDFFSMCIFFSSFIQSSITNILLVRFFFFFTSLISIFKSVFFFFFKVRTFSFLFFKSRLLLNLLVFLNLKHNSRLILFFRNRFNDLFHVRNSHRFYTFFFNSIIRSFIYSSFNAFLHRFNFGLELVLKNYLGVNTILFVNYYFERIKRRDRAIFIEDFKKDNKVRQKESGHKLRRFPPINSAKLLCEHIIFKLERGMSVNQIFKEVKWWQSLEMKKVNYLIHNRPSCHLETLKRYPLDGIRVLLSGPKKKAQRKKRSHYHLWVRSSLYTKHMPLQSIERDIDFYNLQAVRKSCAMGVKVWLLFNTYSYKWRYKKVVGSS